MRTKLIVIIAMLCALPAMGAATQDSTAVKKTEPQVTEQMKNKGGGVVEQPAGLNDLLFEEVDETETESAEGGSNGSRAGRQNRGNRGDERDARDGKQGPPRFSIQVYSGTNSKRAKAEAHARAAAAGAAFPELGAQVIFNSPYWRVRLGAFSELEDANAMVNKVRNRFPSFAKDVRVMRILVASDKNKKGKRK